MKRNINQALALLLCISTAVLSLTACVNVADVDNGATPTTTTASMTAATTTTASAPQNDVPSSGDVATTAPTTTPTTAPPAVDLPDEQRSPNVTYCVPASAPVDKSYFSDVVFVGDSVSLKLTNYHLSTACLGQAAFLTSGSLGVANAMWDLNRADAVHPSYQGETVTVVDGIAKTGRSKVYLMLGVNDLGLYGVDGTVDNFKMLTDQIMAKSPNVKLYIQSVTPLYEDYYGITNAKVNEYNQKISEYCREKGWYFVDVASVMRDANGCLPRDYCSDPDGMGIHFTDKACQIWVEYLFTHTAQ